MAHNHIRKLIESVMFKDEIEAQKAFDNAMKEKLVSRLRGISEEVMYHDQFMIEQNPLKQSEIEGLNRAWNTRKAAEAVSNPDNTSQIKDAVRPAWNFMKKLIGDGSQKAHEVATQGYQGLKPTIDKAVGAYRDKFNPIIPPDDSHLYPKVTKAPEQHMAPYLGYKNPNKRVMVPDDSHLQSKTPNMPRPISPRQRIVPDDTHIVQAHNMKQHSYMDAGLNAASNYKLMAGGVALGTAALLGGAALIKWHKARTERVGAQQATREVQAAKQKLLSKSSSEKAKARMSLAKS